MKANIFNIQKFSIHDGPGIRTVVFFKGCPLRCLWCSNPESQAMHSQLLWNKDKCIGCRKCVNVCPTGSIRFEGDLFNFSHKTCSGCMACVNICPAKALEYTGKMMTIKEVMSEVIKDIDFYQESGGGVTLSGGEVLAQPEFAAALLEELHQSGIHTALETTGYAAGKVFQQVVKYADLLLFDMKHHDSGKHRDYTAVPNELIIANMGWAVAAGKSVIARIPVIPGVNDSLDDAAAFCRLLTKIGIVQVSLLPFHQFGLKKYENLQMEYLMKDKKSLHPEDLVEYFQIFSSWGFDVHI